MRSPLSMSLAPRGTQVAERHGYLIYIAAEQVPNAMYRAWAEIMKDGKRVERSGLVGPRFADAAAAEQYALEWAQQWIDRECGTQAAAASRLIAPQLRQHRICTGGASVARVASCAGARHRESRRAVARSAQCVSRTAAPLSRRTGSPQPKQSRSFSVVANSSPCEQSTDRFSSAYIELISPRGMSKQYPAAGRSNRRRFPLHSCVIYRCCLRRCPR